jgi:ribonuclease BN (tRNA processing enzyme)
MNPLYRAWESREPIKLKNTQYTLRGFSIAGYRTNFYIKELNLMLDAGISGNFSPKKILITHGHSDHIANLPFHLYSGLIDRDKDNKDKDNKDKDNSKIKVYMPEETESLINNYIESMFRLSFHDSDNSVNLDFYESCPVTSSPDNKFINYQEKSNKYQIEIFRCDHSVKFFYSKIKKFKN